MVDIIENFRFCMEILADVQFMICFFQDGAGVM